MLPKDLTTEVKTRLKSLSGQIEGIIRMLDEGRDPGQILHQFKAADKALQKAHFILLDEVYRKALAIKIVKAADACPGNCGNEDRIEFIRDRFPDLKLDELTSRLREISEIEERLKRNQSEGV